MRKFGNRNNNSNKNNQDKKDNKLKDFFFTSVGVRVSPLELRFQSTPTLAPDCGRILGGHAMNWTLYSLSLSRCSLAMNYRDGSIWGPHIHRLIVIISRRVRNTAHPPVRSPDHCLQLET